MRRMLILAVLVLIAAGTALAAPSASTVTVKIAVSSALGSKLIVDSRGRTLYHFTSEKKGSVRCTGGCAMLWPPLTITAGAKPLGGPGITAARLGTIKRPDGKAQVTYNGLALYRDVYDTKAGHVNGQGASGRWYAVTSAGSITKASAKASTSSAAGSNTSPSSSGSTGSTTPEGGNAAAVCVVDDLCQP